MILAMLLVVWLLGGASAPPERLATETVEAP